MAVHNAWKLSQKPDKHRQRCRNKLGPREPWAGTMDERRSKRRPKTNYQQPTHAQHITKPGTPDSVQKKCRLIKQRLPFKLKTTTKNRNRIATLRTNRTRMVKIRQVATCINYAQCDRLLCDMIFSFSHDRYRLAIIGFYLILYC